MNHLKKVVKMVERGPANVRYCPPLTDCWTKSCKRRPLNNMIWKHASLKLGARTLVVHPRMFDSQLINLTSLATPCVICTIKRSVPKIKKLFKLLSLYYF